MIIDNDNQYLILKIENIPREVDTRPPASIPDNCDIVKKRWRAL